jgi:hypothetical protein
MHVGCEHITQHVGMSHVWCCDDGGVDKTRVEHRAVVSKFDDITTAEASGNLSTNLSPLGVRISNCAHGRAVEMKDVLNVLNAHHPRSDDAIPDAVCVNHR